MGLEVLSRMAERILSVVTRFMAESMTRTALSSMIKLELVA